MKFKFIFFLVNMISFFILAVLLFLPSFIPNIPNTSMPGSSSPGILLQITLSLMVALFLLLSAFNAFYFINWRLFFLLEKEDWPALVRYLEDEVIKKSKYRPYLVRLLINSYLVLSDSGAVMSLENKAALIKPALLDANALLFGAARILSKDISGAARFFALRKKTAKGARRDWVCWYYGFALVLGREYEEAGKEFSPLARVSKNSVIAGLSSYFLAETLAQELREKKAEYQKTAAVGRERVLKALPLLDDWNRELSRLSAEIHAAAISKYMAKAGKWLYTENT